MSRHRRASTSLLHALTDDHILYILNNIDWWAVPHLHKVYCIPLYVCVLFSATLVVVVSQQHWLVGLATLAPGFSTLALSLSRSLALSLYRERTAMILYNEFD